MNNKMTAVYIKIDILQYKGKQLFYKKQISTELKPVTEFSDNYFYYNIQADKITPLGKFKQMGKHRTNLLYNDYDHETYEFENDIVFTINKHTIFCTGIPHSDANMVPIEELFYKDYPVYYKNE